MPAGTATCGGGGSGGSGGGSAFPDGRPSCPPDVAAACAATAASCLWWAAAAASAVACCIALWCRWNARMLSMLSAQWFIMPAELWTASGNGKNAVTQPESALSLGVLSGRRSAVD